MGDKSLDDRISICEVYDRLKVITKIFNRVRDRYLSSIIISPMQISSEDRLTIEECISAIDTLQAEIVSVPSTMVWLSLPGLSVLLQSIRIIAEDYVKPNIFERTAKRLYDFNPSGRIRDYVRTNLRCGDWDYSK